MPQSRLKKNFPLGPTGTRVDSEVDLDREDPAVIEHKISIFFVGSMFLSSSSRPVVNCRPALLSLCFIVLLWLSFLGSSMAQSKHQVGGDGSGLLPRSQGSSTKKGDVNTFPRAILSFSDVRTYFSRNQCCGDNCFQSIFCMPTCPSTTPSIGHSIRMNSGGDVLLSERIGGSKDSGSKEDAAYGASMLQFESCLKCCRSFTDRLRNSDDKSAVSDFLVDRLTDKKDPKNGKWVYDVLVDGHSKEVCRNAFMGIYGFNVNEVQYAQAKVNSGVTGGKNHVMTGEKELSKKQIFREFGLDFAEMHRHIHLFTDYSGVTADKPRFVTIDPIMKHFIKVYNTSYN